MLYLILVSIMVFFAVSLSGLFAPPIPKTASLQATSPGYTCCDTGDGENCKPRTDVPIITFRDDDYALLKSNVHLYDYGQRLTVEHLDPAGGKNGNVRVGPKNERVFINPGQKRGSQVYPECTNRSGVNSRNQGYDRLYGAPDPRNNDPNKPGCYRIPDELLIYLCRSDSGPGVCDGRHLGDNAKFDVYIRLRDIERDGIPNVIKNCFKPRMPSNSPKQILFRPSPEGQSNLQLRTFSFIQEPPRVTWLSPYCKPAIYLYPEKKTEVNVSVYPKGNMLLTIPEYPKLGWDVVAEPNGDIYYHNARYDYLYYEASIPDELIAVPEEGYVIEYDNREAFMRDLVTKLGLNEKETQQFVEYWVPILPASPYYFVAVIPEETLNTISPVLITPKPDDLIRVTLYFQPLEEKREVSEPELPSVTRQGFTAVEWGGIFKQDKDHEFSCFM